MQLQLHTSLTTQEFQGISHALALAMQLHYKLLNLSALYLTTTLLYCT